jgi:hypothetical protein
VLNPLPPQDIENTITSRIGSGGFCRHLIDANLRVAANHLAVNAIVLMLQKDCDWFDPRRCRTKLPRLHPVPRSKLASILLSDEEEVVAYRPLVIGRGPLYSLRWRQNLVGRVETGKFFHRLSLLNSLQIRQRKTLVIPTLE